MADYKNMTAIEALREAKDASGMTAESIAQGVGITATHLRRYLDPNDNYAPSLHIIPGLCRVMRNTILLQWLEAQLVADDTPVTPAATRADVLTAVARAGSALGEVQRIVAEAQVLYPSTAREIRSGLGDVIAACRSAQAGLQPLAERRDRDVTLASLSDVHLATGAFELAIELAPQNVNAWSRAADMYARTESNNKAVWAYENVLNLADEEIYPRQVANAGKMLSQFYYAQGNSLQAAKLYNSSKQYYDSIGINRRLDKKEVEIIEIIESRQNEDLESTIAKILQNREFRQYSYA